MVKRKKPKKQKRLSNALKSTGPITLSKTGRFASLKNEMSPKNHAEFLARAAADYDNVISEMKAIAREIAETVSK